MQPTAGYGIASKKGARDEEAPPQPATSLEELVERGLLERGGTVVVVSSPQAVADIADSVTMRTV